MAEASFVEFLFRHQPLTDSEKRYFHQMYAWYRGTHDPTYDHIHGNELASLYIFPYGSGIVKSTPNDWLGLVPKAVRDDLTQFFADLRRKGKDTAFLQCADGNHLRIRIS